MSITIAEIRFLSSLEALDPDNDNVDVHAYLSDGRVFSFLVATPRNLIWCMDNEGNDYYFGAPPVLVVRKLTSDIVGRALAAVVADGEQRLLAYGVLQL
jgi:hypothetical protein